MRVIVPQAERPCLLRCHLPTYHLGEKHPKVLSHLLSLCFYSPPCPCLTLFSTLDLPQDPATHLLNVNFPLLLENKRNFSPRPSSLTESRLLFNLISHQAHHAHSAGATFTSFPFPELSLFLQTGMSFPQSPRASDHEPNITSSGRSSSFPLCHMGPAQEHLSFSWLLHSMHHNPQLSSLLSGFPVVCHRHWNRSSMGAATLPAFLTALSPVPSTL